MIAGTLILEDITITFAQNRDVDNTVDFTVSDLWPGDGLTESFVAVPQEKFFKALAIAVHNDGAPNHIADYPDAESLMGDIRWIP